MPVLVIAILDKVFATIEIPNAANVLSNMPCIVIGASGWFFSQKPLLGPNRVSGLGQSGNCPQVSQKSIDTRS